MVNLVNITNFSGGLLEDKRSGWVGSKNEWTTKYYSLASHFDAFTYPKKLVPHYKTVAAGADSASTQRGYNILQTLYAPYEGGYRLYGLGKVSGQTYVKLFIQNIDAGGLDALTWSAADNGECTVGSQNPGLFFYYNGYIYLSRGSTDISRYKVTATTGFSEGWQTVTTMTNFVQAVHHTSDDLAYFATDNTIYSYDGSSWTTCLTLPSDYTVTTLAQYNDYLAIGMVRNGTLAVDSIVFLWDRDTSLTTLTQRIDFGRGTLRYLANLQGRLIGIMDFYGNNAFSLNKGRLYVKRANGTIADTLNMLTLDTTTTYKSGTNFYIQDEKLYFVASAPLNSDTRLGIWVTDYNGRLALDTQEANVSVAGNYNFIYKTAEMFWIGYYDGTGNVVSRSDYSEGYSSTLASVYESLIFNGGDSSQKNHLLGVTVVTEPLPSAGQIVLKYRKTLENPDGTATTETSWTTISTFTTDNGVSHAAINIESSGSLLPDFNEIQFRIESTGGAVVTGLRFAYEPKPDSPYQP